MFLLIKLEITRVTTSVGTSTNRRKWVLHLGLDHLNPLSINRKFTSKGKLGKNTKWSKGTKGCGLKYMQAMATMDYSFFDLQCIQGVPYIALQRGNEGSNPSDIEAYGRQRVRWFGHTWRKNPKVFGFMHTSQCMWVWGQNSCVHASMGFKVAYNKKQGFLGMKLETSK